MTRFISVILIQKKVNLVTYRECTKDRNIARHSHRQIHTDLSTHLLVLFQAKGSPMTDTLIMGEDIDHYLF